MKKTRSKIIIKTRKGGYTKIYANGKWQKGVYNIDFHADCTPLRYPYIKISCEFDKYKTDKNGSIIYDPEKEEIAKEHVVARIQGDIVKISEISIITALQKVLRILIR